MFNHLIEVRPDLSEKIRATTLDPFYKTSPKDMDEFFYFLEKNW